MRPYLSSLAARLSAFLGRSREEQSSAAPVSTVAPSTVEAAVTSPTPAAIQGMLDDEQLAFWVDWRGEEGEIVTDCESVLQTGKLSAETVEDDSEAGWHMFICFGERRVRVPLTYSEADRHHALVALNEALAPDYEIRLAKDSAGADTLAFVALSTTEWSALERKHGAKVAARFYKLAPKPNVFTEPLNF